MHKTNKMTKYILLIIGMLIFDFSFSQTDTLRLEEDLNILLMKNTFKIEGPNSCGTGFIIAKEKNTNKEYNSGIRDYADLDFILVTAAHVLDSIEGNDAIIFLRTKADNIYKTFPFPISIRNKRFNYYKKHPSMDIAVMYVTLPQIFSNFHQVIDVNKFISDNDIEYWNIRTGETISCLGFPLCYHDTLGNFPILRSGKIASYPLLPSSVYKTFYFDFEIYPGNSGGPVYFFESGTSSRFRADHTFIMGEENIQFIMGMVTESIYIGEIKPEQNIKLGVVIYAKYILETIIMLP